MGQHFMICQKTLEHIAMRMGALEGKVLLEVGAGKGALTKILLQKRATVFAVEKDSRFFPSLEKMAEQYPQQLFPLHQDILTLDWTSLPKIVDGIIGNIPYVISAPLIHRLLTCAPWPPSYKRIVFVVQKELGERLIANPGSSAYGRLSVLRSWRCTSLGLDTIPREAFSPMPAVESVLVSLAPRSMAQTEILAPLEACLHTLFRFPRKTLRNNWPPSLPLIWLEEAGIDQQQRPANLTLETFLYLTQKGGRRWEDLRKNSSTA